jgi:hypothetical protein
MPGGGSIATLVSSCSRWFWTNVADRAGLIVKAAATFDAEGLRHRDLHALDVLTVPDRFDKRIAEAEEQQVFDRGLSEVVFDPIDVVFVEYFVDRAVQRSSGSEAAAERLLDDQAAPARAGRSTELFDDDSERARRHSEVVGRPVAAAQRTAELLERRCVAVVAVDVAERSQQPVHPIAIGRAVALDALFGACAQLIQRPAGFGHRDDRHVEMPAPRHAVQRRKDCLVRQVAGRAEEHERVGMCRPHGWTSKDRRPPY